MKIIDHNHVIMFFLYFPSQFYQTGHDTSEEVW